MGHKSGVYEIRNLLNNHIYIGSSINICKRWKEHTSSLIKGKHANQHLQKAWNKYGEDNFSFRILEECSPVKDTILFLEQKYLDLSPEYNICKIAGNTQGVSRSKECRKKIGEANRKRIIKDSTRLLHSLNAYKSKWNNKQKKKVIMLNLSDGKHLLKFNSISEAARFTGHINHRVNIKRVLAGKQNKAYGYSWKLKNK